MERFKKGQTSKNRLFKKQRIAPQRENDISIKRPLTVERLIL